MNDLKNIAKSVVLPEWATHVAVSKVRKEGEPCAWVEKAQDYVDENPATFNYGDWASSYKHAYWVFIPKEELF